ncbi:MAG TPA: DUF2971 domain-containing protein [Vicinamibacterales bacterium]|jgi:hypothetical protein
MTPAGRRSSTRPAKRRTAQRREASARDVWTAWEALHEKPPATLYHYTTADGLIGILQSRQIWATNVRFMNDTSELAYGIRMVRAIFDEVGRQAADRGIRQARLFGFVSEGIVAMLDDAERNTKHYAVSFCGNGNLLSQWRGYGQAGGGFALGIASSALRNFEAEILPNPPVDPALLGVFLRKVIYEPQVQQQLVRGWVAFLVRWLDSRRASSDDTPEALWASEEANAVARLLYEALVCFKHPGFAEEEEWRLIQQGRIGRQDVCKVTFRARSGRIVSFSPLTFRSTAGQRGNGESPRNDFPLSAVTFGPTLDGEAAERALRLLLESLGFDAGQVQIDPSGIPFAT